MCATKLLCRLIVCNCQKEHWTKVHRHHCKYFSGKKTPVGIEHDPATCPFCLEGEENVKRPDNPKYGCLVKFIPHPGPSTLKTLMGMKLKNKQGELVPVQSPFSWLSTSANSSRIEHTIFVMLNVLCKMHLTRHKITLKYPEEVDNLFCVLHNAGAKCKEIAITYPRSAWPVQMWYPVFCKYMPEAGPFLNKIREDQRISSFKDPFDLWDIFELLAGFLNNRPDLLIKTIHKIPLESYPREVRVLLEKIDIDQQYLIWDQVLAALEDQLVPYSKLVEIFMMDETRRRCGGCKRETRVQMIKTHRSLDAGREMKPFICQWLSGGYVCCRNKACCRKVISRYLREYELLLDAFCAKGTSAFNCDQCFRRCEKVHRCTGCWTKVYCSQECLDKDWEVVHKEVCNLEEDPKKKKDDRRTRVARRDDDFEMWLKGKEKVDEDIAKKNRKHRKRRQR